jgi:6-phosphogluconate dehydrogenase
LVDPHLPKEGRYGAPSLPNLPHLPKEGRYGAPNLLLTPNFKKAVLGAEAGWREVIGAAVALGIPVPAMSASLGYFDSYRNSQLPQNLTQAQRDYFGAHTYQRNDSADTAAVHTDWQKAVHGGKR